LSRRGDKIYSEFVLFNPGQKIYICVMIMVDKRLREAPYLEEKMSLF
jgi:hypothetical protein